jgi:hypothetical protein
MHRHVRFFAIAALAALLAGCSSDPPSGRVRNERPTKANVQFKQASGNSININDVEGGQVTNFQDLIAGRIDVTAVIQDQAVSPAVSFLAEEDHNYTVVVVNSTPPTLRVDAESK